VPHCHLQLMPKQQYFGFKSGARLVQVGNSYSKSIKDRKHHAS